MGIVCENYWAVNPKKWIKKIKFDDLTPKIHKVCVNGMGVHKYPTHLKVKHGRFRHSCHKQFQHVSTFKHEQMVP